MDKKALQYLVKDEDEPNEIEVIYDPSPDGKTIHLTFRASREMNTVEFLSTLAEFAGDFVDIAKDLKSGH